MIVINIQNPGKPDLPLLMMVALLFIAACSRSEDQKEFEQEAFRMPENYTETTPHGEIVSKDEGDWNIGPMFQGSVEIETPPFPNPTHHDPVQIELYISGSRTVDGLRAEAFYDMFDSMNRRTLYQHDRSPLEPGLMVFEIYPENFDRHNNYSNARQVNDGLHRLFIFDNRNNLITYGDIKLK